MEEAPGGHCPVIEPLQALQALDMIESAPGSTGQPQGVTLRPRAEQAVCIAESCGACYSRAILGHSYKEVQ